MFPFILGLAIFGGLAWAIGKKDLATTGGEEPWVSPFAIVIGRHLAGQTASESTYAAAMDIEADKYESKGFPKVAQAIRYEASQYAQNKANAPVFLPTATPQIKRQELVKRLATVILNNTPGFDQANPDGAYFQHLSSEFRSEGLIDLANAMDVLWPVRTSGF